MSRSAFIVLGLLLMSVLLGACNLGTAPEQDLQITDLPTITVPPSRTPAGTGGAPTLLPASTLLPGGQLPPTAIVQLPPLAPTTTQLPVSIVILSPVPGNVVAGNLQVLGAAIHPQFLQYQLEYGPDPNPGNLWFPATGVVQTPVLNGLLGIWNTSGTQDGNYQIRLRVILRDGTNLATVVNNIRVQNQVPTPIPSATPNVPRPIAAFSQDRVTGQVPLLVRFVNQSNGVITNFNWSFGDGGTSTDPNPSYTFNAPGIYNVTLTVIGPGGTSNVSRQITAQGATAPTAAFNADKLSGTAPVTVQFTDQSSGNITGWNWNFGDGATSAERNPVRTFNAVGTYNVILTVTGPGGSSIATRQITVQNPTVPAPVSQFTAAPISGNAPLAVTFTNRSSGSISSFSWNFGDGAISTDQNPSHTYTAPGNYTVTLVVIGPGGQSSSQATVTVGTPPTSTATQTQVAQVPTSTLTATASATVPATSTTTATATATATSTGVPAPVAAAASLTSASGDAPLAVQFQGDQSQNAVSYLWTFGDGGTSADANPSYTFNTPGSYNVTLMVTGADGQTSVSTPITVNANTPAALPVSVASANSATTGDAPLTVQFQGDQSQNAVSYLWTFGDGGTSADANPSYTFATPGTYDVTLTVTGAGGQTSVSTPISVTVNTPPVIPIATALTSSATTGDAPLTVQFQGDQSQNASSFSWVFGDGGTSVDVNPVYTFTVAGTYDVVLTVIGTDGVTSANSDPITIVVNQPVVALPDAIASTSDATTGDAPLTIQFQGDQSVNAATYSWDFGDGGTSADANPLYTFNTPGVYDVRLMVTAADGITTDISDPISVTVNASAGIQPVFTLQLHTDAVYETAWSADSSRVVTASGDDTLGVWETGSGTLVIQLFGHTGDVVTAAFNPVDGNTIASGSTTGDILIWNVAAGTPGAPLTGNAGAVNQLSWSPNGAQIAAAYANNTVLIWDVATGTPVLTLTDYSAGVNTIAWSPDGTRFVTGSSDGQVFIREAASGNIVLTLNAHTESVNALAWKPDGSQLASGSSDNLVYIWDAVNGGGPVNAFSGPSDNINALSWRSDGAQVAGGSSDDLVYIWDAATGQVMNTLSSHTDNVTSVVWAVGGNRLLSASLDTTALVWEP